MRCRENRREYAPLAVCQLRDWEALGRQVRGGQEQGWIEPVVKRIHTRSRCQRMMRIFGLHHRRSCEEGPHIQIYEW